jgi:hypothetical protein
VWDEQESGWGKNYIKRKAFLKDNVQGRAMEGQWIKGERCMKLKVDKEREATMD